MTALLNRLFLKEEKHLMSSSKIRVSAELQKGKITYIGKIIIDDYASRKEVRAVVDNNSERDFSSLKECCPNIDWSKACVDSTLIKN